MSDLPILLARDFVKTPGQPRLLVERRFRPGGVFAEEQLKNAGTDQALVKAAQDDLDRVHPGYPFFVDIDSHQGVAMINIKLLMGNWYEIIHLRDFTQKAVLDAAGRILDRFKLPHGKINFERFLEALPMAISRASDKPPG